MFTKIFIVALLAHTNESLRCVYGGYGSVDGRNGAAPIQNVTCTSETHYCVSLDSDVVFNGEHVKGVAKGCDKEMPDSIQRTFCRAQGCRTENENIGSVNICCCKENYCNMATKTLQFTSILSILLLLYLSF
uniref:Activin_recp domain-containing protein n=1 Tax=Ascaris lumbricoides TaxID=6252 RepID=A0A0M3IEM9_ASCLU